MQCEFNEMQRRNWDLEDIYNKCTTFEEKKKAKLVELDKRYKKFEEQNAEINHMKNLTVLNKELQEQCLKKKKNHFGFFQKRHLAASSLNLEEE